MYWPRYIRNPYVLAGCYCLLGMGERVDVLDSQPERLLGMDSARTTHSSQTGARGLNAEQQKKTLRIWPDFMFCVYFFSAFSPLAPAWASVYKESLCIGPNIQGILMY